MLVDQGITRSRLDTILRSHLIEPETMWDDDFEAFLITRTQNLLALVNQAMGKAPVGARLELASLSPIRERAELLIPKVAREIS